MPLTWKKLGVIIIILGMVAGWRWLDVNGYLGNPLEHVPSVQIGE